MAFINYSNHLSSTWGERQKKAAEVYGEIIDVPFPVVDEEMTSKEVERLAEDEVRRIMENRPDCVMCQGEFCLSFRVIKDLQKNGVKVVAACSKRRVISEILENDRVEKKSIFEFVQFREYV